MILYMAVTPDKYEFPIIVSESLKELSRKSGFSKAVISRAIYRKSKGKRFGIKFIKIEIDE